MYADRDSLLRTAFDTYLSRRNQSDLEPTEPFLPYDFNEIESQQWRPFADEMVKDELRELTNKLNHWHGLLKNWHAWNEVISPHDTGDSWELRREFLETLAHFCLVMPSSARDTLTFVVTNSMHQIRLATSNGYLDYIEGDPKTPEEKPKHLSRKQKEKRLKNIIEIWPEAMTFMTLLDKIDNVTHRKLTSDYRNRNAHSIGPRLGIGITQVVTRSVGQATRLSKQSDGTFSLLPIPNKTSVSYGFGGTSPLDMEEARTLNLEQYRHARECYEHYRHKLMKAGLSSISKIQS